MATQSLQAVIISKPTLLWDQAHVEAWIIDRAAWYYQAIVAGPPQEMPPAAPVEAAGPPPAPPVSKTPPAVPAPSLTVPLLAGTKCPIPGHGGLPLNLVQGDPRPKHPVTVLVQGIRSLDHWCYGEEA